MHGIGTHKVVVRKMEVKKPLDRCKCFMVCNDSLIEEYRVSEEYAVYIERLYDYEGQDFPPKIPVVTFHTILRLLIPDVLVNLISILKYTVIQNSTVQLN
jgi:hypothetical protein